jgi:hypothetical protein
MAGADGRWAGDGQRRLGCILNFGVLLWFAFAFALVCLYLALRAVWMRFPGLDGSWRI